MTVSWRNHFVSTKPKLLTKMNEEWIRPESVFFTWSQRQRRHSSQEVHPVPLHTTLLWQTLFLPESAPLLPSYHQPTNQKQIQNLFGIKANKPPYDQVDFTRIKRAFQPIWINSTRELFLVELKAGTVKCLRSSSPCASYQHAISQPQLPPVLLH